MKNLLIALVFCILLINGLVIASDAEINGSGSSGFSEIAGNGGDVVPLNVIHEELQEIKGILKDIDSRITSVGFFVLITLIVVIFFKNFSSNNVGQKVF